MGQSRFSAGAVCAGLLLALLPASAGAASPAPSAAGAATDAAPAAAAGAKAAALLAAIAARGASAQARAQAASRLAALGPAAVPAISKFLARTRTSTDAERRAVLATIHAAVPDQKGRFHTKTRPTDKQLAKEDARDWLKELLATGDSLPGEGEVIADVAAIHALAADKNTAAANAIIDFTFSADGLIYRDECGRYLRKMSPWSLPALIRTGHTRGHWDRERYARYQVERLDRENAFKALAAAANEDLKIQILNTYGDTHLREAVFAVFAHVDNISPAVRAAARAAWMKYVTGPPPHPAPKRKLKLTGGKKTDKKMPLWLTYRELADIILHRKYKALMGKPAPRHLSLPALSHKIFDYYDQQREKQLEANFTAAKKLADAGQVKQATAAYDRILVQNPRFPERAQMAGAYLTYGRALQKQKQWRAASTAYAKANALDPTGPHADEALAAHHFTRGKALAAEGKEAKGEFKRAQEIKASHVHKAVAAADPAGSRWMLFGGIGGGIAALALLLVGLWVRQRRARIGAGGGQTRL